MRQKIAICVILLALARLKWTSRAPDDRFMRNLLAQCCCAAGGLGGLWLGFLAAPKEAGSAHVLRALAQVLIPVAWHVGIGVLTGVLVAWMLTVAVPWSWSSRQ